MRFAIRDSVQLMFATIFLYISLFKVSHDLGDLVIFFGKLVNIMGSKKFSRNVGHHGHRDFIMILLLCLELEALTVPTQQMLPTDLLSN